MIYSAVARMARRPRRSRRRPRSRSPQAEHHKPGRPGAEENRADGMNLRQGSNIRLGPAVA